MTRGALFAAAFAPFVVLATINSAGYRFGASDQAFYLPAIVDRLEPALFPRDSELIGSQARLTLVDETVAALAAALPVSLPALFGGLYLVSLGLLAWGGIAFGSTIYRTRWALVALLAALTLRHAITRTGTNTLEGYFHPRQLAFGLGVIAVAAFLRRRDAVPAVLLVGAGLVHPTTAMWFVVWLAVAAFVAEPRWRVALVSAAIIGGVAGAWALAAGPLTGRLAAMDQAWLATLGEKAYLFPLEWPPAAWLVNLGYIPVIVAIWNLRRRLELLAPRETAVMAGCLALIGVFACALALQTQRVALAIQLQPARIFWMLDFLAIAYAVWFLAEGGRPHGRRPMWAAAAILLLAVARGTYVAAVRFAERPMASVGIPADDWGRVMAWARSSTSVGSHWLADPVHAALYGTSVRVAGHRDVFVEAIKDSAIGMYSRPVAMRTRERLEALGHFGELTPALARDLAGRYGLDYLVTDQPLDLPAVFRSGRLTVYGLR